MLTPCKKGVIKIYVIKKEKDGVRFINFEFLKNKKRFLYVEVLKNGSLILSERPTGSKCEVIFIIDNEYSDNEILREYVEIADHTHKYLLFNKYPALKGNRYYLNLSPSRDEEIEKILFELLFLN